MTHTLEELIINKLDDHLTKWNIPQIIIDKWEHQYCGIHNKYHMGNINIHTCHFCKKRFCEYFNDSHGVRLNYTDKTLILELVTTNPDCNNIPMSQINKSYGYTWCGTCLIESLDENY